MSGCISSYSEIENAVRIDVISLIQYLLNDKSIIDENLLSPSATERAVFATQNSHPNTDDELYFLQLLTDLECSSSPKLISWSQEKQSDNMWVSGGYIVFMLMEKLSGVMIKEQEFWEEYSLEKRDEIRKAFHDAIM